MTSSYGNAAMEPDDLKLAWQTLSRRLERHDALQTHVLLEQRKQKALSSLRPLFWGQVVQTIFGIPFIGLAALLWIQGGQSADGLPWTTIVAGIVVQLYGIATIAMFYAVARWNEYFKAGLYLLSPDKTTLQVLIRKFVVQGDITDLIGFSNMMNKTELANVNYNSLKSAAIVVGVAPILLIYPFALKFYAKDVMEGGVKE